MGDDAGPEHHAVQGWYRSKRLEIRSSSIQNPFSSFDPLRQRLRGEYELRQRQTLVPLRVIF